MSSSKRHSQPALSPSDSSSRIIRPPEMGDGVLLNDRHFRLQDVDELVEELTKQSEGRLEELREAAQQVEERIRLQADESRAKIEQAMKLARDSIDQQIEDTTRKSQEVYDRRHREGFDTGNKEGYEAGYAAGLQEGLETGLREGRERGREEGESSAREEVMTTLRGETESVAKMLRGAQVEFEQDWQQLFQGARVELMQLVTEVAARVLRKEIRELPEAVTETLAAAIERISGQTKLTVEVNPADRSAADRYVASIMEDLASGEAIEVKDVDSVERGGCRVRGPEAVVDLTVKTQLEILEKRLLESTGVSA
ncbi:MAG: FliH/SctL family protein [Planctomycetota bacterium]